jgi:hypothetical protein
MSKRKISQVEENDVFLFKKAVENEKKINLLMILNILPLFNIYFIAICLKIEYHKTNHN